MIRIRISILLAFSLLPKKSDGKKSKKEKKGKKGKAKKEGKGSKSDKSSKKSKGKKENKDVKVVVEKPKYLFEVGSPVGFSHIEYELIPGQPKYQVDVVCWGPVAKVFSADGDVILKTYVKDEIAWVPISLKHILNTLEVPDLFKLYRHVINYTIWSNKKKLGARLIRNYEDVNLTYEAIKDNRFRIQEYLCLGAKSENTKAFFIREEDIDSPVKFTEAYNNNPNLEKCEDEKDKRLEELEKEIKSILWECADKPGNKNYNEIVTRLEFLSDPVHLYQVNKIIDRVMSGKEVECKDFVSICPPPLTDEDLNKKAEIKKPTKKGKKGKEKDKGKKGKDKKSKKSEKGNKKSKKGNKGKKGDEVLKIVIPGEVLYTDPNLNIYDLRTSNSDINHAFILSTVTKLMSRKQKYSLNPLIIKIKKISNLPVDVLADHRFSAIYAYYSIPYIARCSTIEKPLAKTIKFNEAHAHFTDSVPKLKLLEFMQSQRLYIEIRGVREDSIKSHQPNLFGTEKNDENISTKVTTRECAKILTNTEEPSTVTLGVACFDISSLLKPTWDCLEKASLQHPDKMTFQKADTMYENFKFIDTLTINEVNLGVVFKPKSFSPLTESLLSDFDTTLKVEVYLSAPHNAFLEVYTNPEIYHRMFVVVNYAEIAMTLLNEIMLHNQQILGPLVLAPIFLSNSTINDAGRKDSQRSEDSFSYSGAITGFVIDNGNSYAFFIEGLANGFISEIWRQIMDANEVILKIFYNSDFCFEKRLYSEFIKYGGIYFVTLKLSLDEIMNQDGIYLEGNVPIPCWEALKKLNIMFKCLTLRSMVQYCLFPTPTQLVSLDMEWGVPFKWRKSQNLDVEHKQTETLGRLDSNLLLRRVTEDTDLRLSSQTTMVPNYSASYFNKSN